MKTWSAILHATNSHGGTSLHFIFVRAYTIEKAQEKCSRACRITFPESKGYTEHVAVVQDTQVMYEGLSFIQEWDDDENQV